MIKVDISCPKCGSSATKKLDDDHFVCESCSASFLLQNDQPVIQNVHNHRTRVINRIVGDGITVDSLEKAAEQAFIQGNFHQVIDIAKDILRRDANNVIGNNLINMPFYVLGATLSYDQVKEICDALKSSTGYENCPHVQKAREMLSFYTGCKSYSRLVKVLKQWFTFGFPEPYVKPKRDFKPLISFVVLLVLAGIGVGLYFILR